MLLIHDGPTQIWPIHKINKNKKHEICQFIIPHGFFKNRISTVEQKIFFTKIGTTNHRSNFPGSLKKNGEGKIFTIVLESS